MESKDGEGECGCTLRFLDMNESGCVCVVQFSTVWMIVTCMKICLLGCGNLRYLRNVLCLDFWFA